ncbi:hypothetical protein C8F01DRAFT_1015144 [Mycena amicta]|nr:hypothetical protein C8F01DRAFT_1015144 [Mycena amicta]
MSESEQDLKALSADDVPEAQCASSESTFLQSTMERDKEYFYPTGDCVLLVEGTLFKLHKERLTRDADSEGHAFFRDLFQDAQDGTTDSDKFTDVEYFNDDDHDGKKFEIIRGIDDSVDDFKALCWALYALPGDTQKQTEAGADIPRLVSVANLSHKYIMPSYESWALDMVFIHGKSPDNYFDSCPQNMLYRVFEAAVAGGREDICLLVESAGCPG